MNTRGRDKIYLSLLCIVVFSIFIHRNLVSDFQGKQENEFLFLFGKKKIEKKTVDINAVREEIEQMEEVIDDEESFFS